MALCYKQIDARQALSISRSRPPGHEGLPARPALAGPLGDDGRVVGADNGVEVAAIGADKLLTGRPQERREVRFPCGGVLAKSLLGVDTNARPVWAHDLVGRAAH